jgi:hypothetical protein
MLFKNKLIELSVTYEITQIRDIRPLINGTPKLVYLRHCSGIRLVYLENVWKAPVSMDSRSQYRIKLRPNPT